MTDPMARKAKRLYVGRSLLAPLVSWRWNRFIRDFHRGCHASEPVARVLLKPLRSYVHRQYRPRRRLALLLEHYDWFNRTFAPSFLKAFCSNEELEIVELVGRKGAAYKLYLAASVVATMQREGEISIYLAKSPHDTKLCRSALCYSRALGHDAMILGGLQGPLTQYKREVIDATRDLNGLRPKDAVLLAVRAFGQALGVERLHAVCDAHHVLNRLQDKGKLASYDSYWLERGGKPRGPFGFEFGPLAPLESTADKREARKIAIVNGVNAFVNKWRRIA